MLDQAVPLTSRAMLKRTGGNRREDSLAFLFHRGLFFGYGSGDVPFLLGKFKDLQVHVWAKAFNIFCNAILQVFFLDFSNSNYLNVHDPVIIKV